MKILYSQIKELIPNIKVSPQKIGEVFTIIGFMMDGFREVEYRGKKDFLLSLEIRQNRADCLSIIGLAKEIAAYYGLKSKLPLVSSFVSRKNNLKIVVDAGNYIRRILAIRIVGLENKESPVWLKEFLAFYDINSINFLVDLSNYIMLITGYPSHLIAVDKINGFLKWSINKDFSEIVTLDGSSIKLNKENELIIQDEKTILALAGIVGGKSAEITLDTKSIIAEIAVYDRSIIRKNSRSLRIVTEASHRLEKDLDPNGANYAIELLISLILENCGGVADSKVFDYYPKKRFSSNIEFDIKYPSIYAGIEIPKKKVLKIIKNLGFVTKQSKNRLIVIPPTYRMDISIPADIVEEVIRIFGYEKIPSNEIPILKVVKDITPKRIHLAEKIRDILTVLDFDEIFSWTLTKKGDNLSSNYLDWEIINTQNSVNEFYPELRQTIAIGLVDQFNEYLKKNIEYIKIFEIGKVFGKRNGIYEECESAGILIQDKDIKPIKETLDKLLRHLGFVNIKYRISKNKPRIANPYSCWDIFVEGQIIGIFYKLKLQKNNTYAYFAEINLDKITKLLNVIYSNPAVELTKKLILLDANIEIDKDESIYEFLDKVCCKIKPDNIWSIDIIDRFVLDKKMKYTIRVSYKELLDKEAKKIHLNAFGLVNDEGKGF